MEVIYLVFFFSWYAGRGVGVAVDIESLPQASIEQCQENGAALKEMYSEIKFKCIKGVGPL